MTVELRDLTPAERKTVQLRFEELAGKRFAPSSKKPRQELWWPKAPLDGRAFPEGIQPAQEDGDFNEAARLIGFLNGAGGGEYYVGNLSAPKPFFRHTGKLDDELARWIKTRLVSNPTCLLSASSDVLLIHDSSMRFSVLGATPDIIDKFEKRFGGADGLQRTFGNYVDQMGVGAGMDDAKWARDYLQKWSGWV